MKPISYYFDFNPEEGIGCYLFCLWKKKRNKSVKGRRKKRQKRRREFKDGLELNKHEGQSLMLHTYGNTKGANHGRMRLYTWSGLHSTLWQ